MGTVTDYQLQVAKLKKYNQRVAIITAAILLCLFIAGIAYAVYLNDRNQKNTEQILRIVTAQGDATRRGGDITRCILNIPATTRTQAQINKCYPGGDPVKWQIERDRQLNDN